MRVCIAREMWRKRSHAHQCAIVYIGVYYPNGNSESTVKLQLSEDDVRIHVINSVLTETFIPARRNLNVDCNYKMPASQLYNSHTYQNEIIIKVSLKFYIKSN